MVRWWFGRVIFLFEDAWSCDGNDKSYNWKKYIHRNTRNKGIESLRISIQGVMNSSKGAGQYFLNSYEIKQVRSFPLRASYPQPTSTNRKCQGSKGMKLSMMKTWETSTKEIDWFEIHQIDSEIPKFAQGLLPTSNTTWKISFSYLLSTHRIDYRAKISKPCSIDVPRKSAKPYHPMPCHVTVPQPATAMPLKRKRLAIWLTTSDAKTAMKMQADRVRMFQL